MAQTTKEIGQMINGLNLSTLKDSITASKKGTAKNLPSKKADIINKYQETVVEFGVENFVTKIDDALKDALSNAGITGGKEELQKHITSDGLEKYLQKCDKSLLNQYQTKLGLDASENSKELAKQIEDEIVLNGMKLFLSALKVDILKKYCEELELPRKAGLKKEHLVDRLMVHTFQLEPQFPDADEKGEKTEEKKTSKRSKEKKEKKEDSEKSEKSEKDKPKRSRKEKEDSEKSEKSDKSPSRKKAKEDKSEKKEKKRKKG